MKPPKLPVTPNAYETAWREIYNKQHKEVQRMIDKAKGDDTYYPREVRLFVLDVIALAQEGENPKGKK